MTYFTDNPMERLMQQKPIPEQRKARQNEKPEDAAEQAPDSSSLPDTAPLLIDRLRQTISCALDRMA